MSGSMKPGWNDPPVLAYNECAVGSIGGSKRAMLSRRVGFPINGAKDTPGQRENTPCDPTAPPTSIPKGPPPMALPTGSPPVGLFMGTPPLSSSPTISTEAAMEALASYPKEDLDKVLNKFEKFRIACLPHLQHKEEVDKRIDIFRSSWWSKTLHPSVRFGMTQLINAMCQGKYGEADKLHRSLMVDHVSQVSPWMVGVRQLILCGQENEIKTEDVVEDTKDPMQPKELLSKSEKDQSAVQEEKVESIENQSSADEGLPKNEETEAFAKVSEHSTESGEAPEEQKNSSLDNDVKSEVIDACGSNDEL